MAITFDFGYLDNLTIAAPILARYDLPATFFLATDYVEDGREHWGDRLYNIFRMRRHQVLEFEGQSFALNRAAQARAAYLLLCRELEQLPSRRVRDVWLDQIEDNLGAAVRLPKLTLDWEAVQGLCELSPRFDVAALGAGQIDLTAHPEEVVRDDVLRCVQSIDAHTGAGPQHFGFPFGRCNLALRNLLLELGLKSGKPGWGFGRPPAYQRRLRDPAPRCAPVGDPARVLHRGRLGVDAIHQRASSLNMRTTVVIVTYRSKGVVEQALDALAPIVEAGKAHCVVVDNASARRHG